MNSFPPTSTHQYHSLAPSKLTCGLPNGCGVTTSSSNSLRVLFLINSAAFFSVMSGFVDVQLSFITIIEVFVVGAAASDNAALSVTISISYSLSDFKVLFA